MKNEIDKLVEQYSQYISEDIKNQNTGAVLIKFNQRKQQFLNSEFEKEKKQHIKKIEEAIIYFKNRALRCSNDAKNNHTYILENNEGHFLEFLHY